MNNKQPITRQEIIRLINSMKNKINQKGINQYINTLLSLDDQAFQQELSTNNITTIADAEEFLKDKLSKQKCTLSDLNVEDTYFHFTDQGSLPQIKEEGLISRIGKHSEGIDKKESIFFSYGMIPTLQGADTWIKFIMHRMYGEKNQFGVYDGLSENETKAKQHEWGKKFLSREYLTDADLKKTAFELLYKGLKEKVFLTLDLRPGIDFSFDDTDYNKMEALAKKEKGDIIPYLYMREMYGIYSNPDSTNMDKWNMHTHFGATVEPERIMQVTDSRGRTDMLHILMEMYDKCKAYGDMQLDILEDFISYTKEKELKEEKIPTQRGGREISQEQKDLELMNAIKRLAEREEKERTKKRDFQEDKQDR